VFPSPPERDAARRITAGQVTAKEEIIADLREQVAWHREQLARRGQSWRRLWR
jgi:hypothetical protein